MQEHSFILTAIYSKAIELNEAIGSFKHQDSSFSSQEFLNFVSLLKRFGNFSIHMQNPIEEQKSDSKEYDFLWNQQHFLQPA